MDSNHLHTVLIVSDDRETAATREALFHQKNCAVISETSPRDAVKTARLFSPSLLILDLGLPHPEQVSLCRELRAASNGIILLLSSTKDEQKNCEYYLAGVDEHLTKPLPPIVLIVKSMAWLVRREWQDIQIPSFS